MIHIAFLFMALGLVSFASMGVLHKLGDHMEANPLSLALIAMSTGSPASLLYALIFQRNAIEHLPRIAVLLALPFGASAALGLWFLQKALRHGNIATSWLMINLSAGIPTALSMIFYREPLTPRKSVAFLLMIAALVLLWWDRRGHVQESH
jgi:drug/metabolite transporter (DMT)-like permease